MDSRCNVVNCPRVIRDVPRLTTTALAPRPQQIRISRDKSDNTNCFYHACVTGFHTNPFVKLFFNRPNICAVTKLPYFLPPSYIVHLTSSKGEVGQKRRPTPRNLSNKNQHQDSQNNTSILLNALFNHPIPFCQNRSD